MIEISQIRMPCGADPQLQMDNRIRRMLRLKPDVTFRWKITRHAVDARRKPELYDVYSVHVTLTGSFARMEREVLKRLHHERNIRACVEERYVFPCPASDAQEAAHRPVVIGFGPAGIFCALMLARAGFRPIVFERGQRMEERIASVDAFWKDGRLNPESNIQFGEGGAGTFSDGKLNSNVRNTSGRITQVLETFVQAGAPEDILYEQIPHIGTDRLRGVIRNLREEILSLGGEIRFDTKVTGLVIRAGKICAVRYRCEGTAGPDMEENLTADGTHSACLRRIDEMSVPEIGRCEAPEDRSGAEQILPCEIVVLAPGHSARDTMLMLRAQGIPMEAKPFAVGFRVSHPQALINRAQYGISDPEQIRNLRLSPANYKLTAKTRDGRGVYSFCMCPGGYVVNASSEPGRLTVNGMSDYLRNSPRANSAIVMSVGEKDYPEDTDPVLAGMRFQEELEAKAYTMCGGRVPVQRFISFEEAHVDTDIPSAEDLCIRGKAEPGPLHELLPANLTEDFIEGMHEFGRRIRGYDGEDAYVIGLESRTSSPVRILRDDRGESEIGGLYPCGEGAGYAGGITSAAVDGIRTAEHIAHRYRRHGTYPDQP